MEESRVSTVKNLDAYACFLVLRDFMSSGGIKSIDSKKKNYVLNNPLTAVSAKTGRTRVKTLLLLNFATFANARILPYLSVMSIE